MISVVIPTYNRSSELPRAIDSVINQTYQDWELIIIDDGSKDNTSEVVKKYTEQNDKIAYHYFLNMGAGVARNIGISLSKGELVAFLDSDDIWTQNRLFSVYEIFRKEKDLNTFYLTDFRNNEATESLFQRKYIESPDFKQMLLASNFLGGTINMVIPRQILSELQGFDSMMTSTEDHDLYVRLVENYNLQYIPGEFAIYYLDSSNRISSKNNRRLSGQLFYYHKHKGKMSYLSKLLVMKKNALLARWIGSKFFYKYLPAMLIIKFLKIFSGVNNDLELFQSQNSTLKYLRTHGIKN